MSNLATYLDRTEETPRKHPVDTLNEVLQEEIDKVEKRRELLLRAKVLLHGILSNQEYRDLQAALDELTH